MPSSYFGLFVSYDLLDLPLDSASQPANLPFPHMMSLPEDVKGSCFPSGNKRSHEPFIAPERFGNSAVGFGCNVHSQAPEKVTLLVTLGFVRGQRAVLQSLKKPYWGY